MKAEMERLARDVRTEMQKDGLLPRTFALSVEDALLVRKILGAVNLLCTVADGDYKENRIDGLYRRLKAWETESTK